MKITADTTIPLRLVHSDIWNAIILRVFIQLHMPEYELYTTNHNV
jgi:hypothetical protein